MAKATEIFEAVTAQIVAAIEEGQATGSNWTPPWSTLNSIPTNATTHKAYRGGNVIVLWITESARGYATSEWATYKQWEAAGAQVRKGEKGTSLVKWSSIKCKTHGPEERCLKCGRLVPFGFTVFNAAQVDGYEAPAVPERPVIDTIAAADAFFAATGADIRHAGGRAFYASVGDYIQIPEVADFLTTDGYYSTLAHEATHWTGHSDRLDRTFGKRFGDDAYAAEELVAELGAAFLCATLGVTVEPRADHAEYLASWLKCLKAEPQALFDAASKAQKAVDFLEGKAAGAVEVGTIAVAA
jgi:antirestriction protein ArdC